MIEVGAKGAAGHSSRKIDIRRRNNADINTPHRQGTQAPKATGFEHVQESGLRIKANVADFIQKDGAALSGLE
jgi:hypothetical protein